MERNQPCGFQAPGILLTKVRDPVVPGLAERIGILRLLALISVEGEGTEQDRHIDSLTVHGLELGDGIKLPFHCFPVMWGDLRFATFHAERGDRKSTRL